MIKRYINFLWHSPTFTTWGSFLSKSLSLILILPLILTKFSEAEIGLWYLFLILISFQFLFDIGFGITFSRVISFAFGGSENIDDLRFTKEVIKSDPNWRKVNEIVKTMYYLYPKLAILFFIVLGAIGSVILFKPINATLEPLNNWLAWGIILTVTSLYLYGNIYSNYILGLNKVALLRRWEAITSTGATLTSFFVLIFTDSLLILVIAHQSWILINLLRNRWLARKIESNRFIQFSSGEKIVDFDLVKIVWSKAWRSSLGQFMSYGVVQSSGLLYAQLGSTSSVASYLLALRIIDTIKGFSQAPFYSKLPLMARLRAEGNNHELINVAGNGMRLALFSFVIPFIFVGIFIESLLSFIGSNAQFISTDIWILLGFGYLLERYGGMHIQLYSTTNHIIWHIANGISGSIYLIVSFILLDSFGLYAFPIGIIAGFLLFYIWYALHYSYKLIDQNFWKFESRISFVPITLFIIYSLLNIL